MPGGKRRRDRECPGGGAGAREDTGASADMTADERKTLVEGIAELVKKHGLDDKVKVKTARETVCQLNAKGMQDSFSIAVEASLSPDRKAACDAFKAEVGPLTEGVEGVKVAVNVMLGAGCPYDPIKNVVPIRGEEPVTLNHVEGEVWMIDFWATWCPPCQAPMAHNEQMLANNGAKWGEKVKIIGISIDKTADVVVKHVDAKDWNRPTHYWRGQSDCSDQYAVRGVPNVMIIDTKGMIVFKGHPANRPNLEQDFNDLLEGKEITGAGTANEDKPKEEGAEGETATKQLDAATCMQVIDEFNSTVGPALQANEKVAEAAKKMPRGFCVMVYEDIYNCTTGESKIDWKNYRVLVGPQDAIDTCKEEIEAAVKGDFEIVLRENAI